MKNILKLLSCKTLLIIFRHRLKRYMSYEEYYRKITDDSNFYTQCGIPEVKRLIKALERLQKVFKSKIKRDFKDLKKKAPCWNCRNKEDCVYYLNHTVYICANKNKDSYYSILELNRGKQ